MMQQGCVYEMAVNVFNMLNDTSLGKYWRKKKRIEENRGAGEMCFRNSNVYTQKYATILIFFLCTLKRKLAIIMNFSQKF